MSEAEARPSNFIRQIIDEDLASGKHTTIHTRFPPEPNGYLHIGHAKSICLNFGIAQDYKGQCNLRFDDTNPVKEDIEYVESIKNDVQWLGFNWSGDICYSSDYFDQLFAYAVELINKGLAYVDELSADEIREYRGSLTAPGKTAHSAIAALKRISRCSKNACGWLRRRQGLSACQNRYGVSVHRDARSGVVPYQVCRASPDRQ